MDLSIKVLQATDFGSNFGMYLTLLSRGREDEHTTDPGDEQIMPLLMRWWMPRIDIRIYFMRAPIIREGRLRNFMSLRR